MGEYLQGEERKDWAVICWWGGIKSWDGGGEFKAIRFVSCFLEAGGDFFYFTGVGGFPLGGKGKGGFRIFKDITGAPRGEGGGGGPRGDALKNNKGRGMIGVSLNGVF